MKTLLPRLFAVLLLSVLLPAVQAEPRAQFEPNGFSQERKSTQQVRPRLSASEAAARVQASEGGRILSVETVGNGSAYRIKVLNRHAQVKVIVVDAGGGR